MKAVLSCEILKKRIVTKLENKRQSWNEEFYECIKDLATHPAVLRMKRHPHHGTTNCYQHCINVAYYNYQWCRVLHLDAHSAARGGMLHDMFLYDWHTHAKCTGDSFHGLTHPAAAHRNAVQFFHLNKIEKDIILNHMWPLTFWRLPRTREGFISTLTDKYCGACETGTSLYK